MGKSSIMIDFNINGYNNGFILVHIIDGWKHNYGLEMNINGLFSSHVYDFL